MLFSVLPDTSTGAGVSVESSVITSVVSVRSVSAFVTLLRNYYDQIVAENGDMATGFF